MTKPKKPTKTPEKIVFTDTQKSVVKALADKRENADSRPASKFIMDADGKVNLDCTEHTALVHAQLANTTGCADTRASTELLSQVMNILPDTTEAQANAMAQWMNGIAPQDEVEGMLAAQMVAAHTMIMRFARRAAQGQYESSVDSNVKRVTKLMGAFSKHLETLTKYRTKGQQTIQVQHVQVNEGGQAIVGNVTQHQPNKREGGL